MLLFHFLCIYISGVPFVKKMPKLRVLPFLGSISFYMFLWHTPVNIVLKLLNLNCMTWMLFVLSFSVSILLSVVQYLINNKWVGPLCGKISFATKDVSEGKI